jgi:hypothetical protein
MALNQGKVQQQASIAIMKKSIGNAEQQGNALQKLLRTADAKAIQHAAEPHRGSNLVLAAYEEKDYAKVKEINQFTLLPTVKQLQDSISTQFSRYVVS